LAVGGIDTREILVVTKARFEDTFLSVVRGIVGTTNTVVDVFTEVCSIWTGGVTSFETELLSTHEIVPFDNLLVGVVISAPGCRIEKTAERVSSSISTVGIQFPSRIARFDVNLALVDEPNDLNVIGCPHELDTLKRTGRNGTSATTRLRAPCNFLTFGVGNERVRFGRGPEAEIAEII